MNKKVKDYLMWWRQWNSSKSKQSFENWAKSVNYIVLSSQEFSHEEWDEVCFVKLLITDTVELITLRSMYLL